jgi:hypothetical protein
MMLMCTPLALLGLLGLAAHGVNQPPPDAEPTPAFQFQKELAWKHLVKQCEFGPRVPGTKAHTDCQAYLLEEMKKVCDNVHVQSFNHLWPHDGKTYEVDNIVGDQNWKDAKIHVLLTAHWDSRPFADQDPDLANHNTPILGADDGASGVAVLLELMRALKGRLKDVGVVYLLNDAEDFGPDIDEMLLGTIYYAQHPSVPKPDYGILLDMIGNKNVRVPMEQNSVDRAPDIMNAFYDAMKVAGLEATFPKVAGDWVEDDHFPLIKAGIPTIDLIDFQYKPWHTIGDTVDKCSAESLGKIGQGLEVWLLKSPPFKPQAKSNDGQG